MQIHGACYCGNIGFRLDWQPEPGEIPARACGCALEGLDPSLLRRTSADFEGEDPVARLARRARGWIPRVRFVSG